MITLLTGVPGSGKTYLAVNRMIEDKKPVHTNIELNENFTSSHTFFVWDDFYIKLKSLYEFRDEPQMFIDLSKELGVFGISIYFDECHIKLSEQDKIVVWWLSIHRHMAMEVMLITQAKGALAQKYRLYPEIFIDAQTATKRFFSSVMSYYEYATYRMHKKDDLIRKFSFKADSKIFEMYRTGEKNKGSTTLRKKAYMIIPIIFLPILSFYYILNMFGKDEVTEVEKVVNVENNNTNIKNIADNIKSDLFVKAEIIGKYFAYDGWLLPITNEHIRVILSLPHQAHKISNDYIKLQFEKKYITHFDKLLVSKNI